jgi:copper chaperone
MQEENIMITLKVEGMSRGHCQKAVSEALKNASGSDKVSVDLSTGIAKVEADADVSKLIAAVQEEGYQASVA